MKIVYDSYTQGNVYDFADKLGYKIENIEQFKNNNNEKIFLVTKTVKFGEIPNTTLDFLQKNSFLVIGIAVSGNKNFGENFGKAGELISQKFNIPLVLKFEGKGFNKDIEIVKKWLRKNEKEEKNQKTIIPSWIILNNEIIDEEGNIKNLKKDKEALAEFLKKEIKPKLKKFETLEKKITYLIENEYYESDFFSLYEKKQVKTIFQIAYQNKIKFLSFIGAFKFYKDYALKSRDKKEYLETYEDRLSINALYHASGDFELAKTLIQNLIKQNFTPATPTLLNTGLKKRGEFVSCFLLEAGDSLNDISRINEFSMQLSKIGGGVSLNLTNLRAKGESIKGINNSCKGVIGVAKLLDYSFRYADQMGQRLGAGAVYLNVFHSDIVDLLNTKKLNADDDIRLKTLSLGVVIPDKMIELARKNEMMALFYPHTVFLEYGINFADIAIDMNKWYDILLKNPKVKKRFINPRYLLELISQIQGESGYPYLMFSDNVNRVNTSFHKVKFSNLCTEILQPSITSHYAFYDQRETEKIGMDISCNLSSGHMGNMIRNKAIKETVFSAMDLMNSVSTKTNIHYVPGICKANFLNRSVGFGIMGHHGFISEEMIEFGSEENLELIDVFFNAVNYFSLLHSYLKAKETKQKFYQFEKSTYANGTYFEDKKEIFPKTKKIKKIFENIELPTNQDWQILKEKVMKYGLYNSHRLAVAPNGSIGYLMSATPSLTPIKQLVEERTYGNLKAYSPAPSLAEFAFMYQTAYNIDKYKLIDVIATAQKHIDQGISFELCINSDITTRELQRYYLYAHHKGIKTLYYTRTNKLKVFECKSCGV